MVYAAVGTYAGAFELREAVSIYGGYDDARSWARTRDSATVIEPGFLAVYEEGRDQKTDEDDDEGRRLPAMKEGDMIPLSQVLADQHFTEPPPRYSEASLIKRMEELGIGRPSTYASIISVLQSRSYVRLEQKRFEIGRASCRERVSSPV